MSNANANDVGMKVRDDLIKQLKEHHSKTLQSLLTKEQIEEIFSKALANPDEAQFPLGEDEIVEAVQRFLKQRDELVDEIECRKSHTDTEIGELKEELKILNNYREEMREIEKITEGEVEDILDVAGYIKDKEETIAYGRGVISGLGGRLTDATELLNTLGYTFEEDTETWEEKEKVVWEDGTADIDKEAKEDEKKALEEEVDDRIKSVWIELYAQDKYGCKASWKSIADLIDYDEEIAKKLYEEEYPEDADSDEE